ncbi:hypothetical protein PV441_44250, partial [Streptomyces stelliscabiei]|uniref:hypothetical protein n=2 Tax=Streptomyces stelliscabiei TaxID=146820 RepID=UPI0029A39456
MVTGIPKPYTGPRAMHLPLLPAQATALARVPQFALARIDFLSEFRLRNSIPALAPESELRLRNSHSMPRLAGAYPC